MRALKVTLLTLALIGFQLLSIAAARDEGGYVALWALGFRGLGEMQLLCDLMVTSVIALGWLIPDARARELNPWPFVLITALSGSIGLLLYLIWRELWSARDESREESSALL